MSNKKSDSDHVTYANIRRNTGNNSTTIHVTGPSFSQLKPISHSSPAAQEDQPPPPPKTRPPAMTPPLLPTTTTTTTSTNSLGRNSNKVRYSQIQTGSSKTAQSSSSLQPHASSINIRSYVRSPGTYLSYNNNNNNNPQTPTPCDEESFLNSLSREDLVARIKIIESKNRKLIKDNGQMMKDLNQHLNQLTSMKHHNFQLMTENNELRDLCCYLDDERSRARSLAKEWQSFGTHMSRVMRHEVSSYAKKLQVLEEKQFELVRENFELKQLCIMLDNSLTSRVDSGVGDGSSGSMASSSNDGGDAASSLINQNGVVSNGIRDGRNPITAAVHPPNSSRFMLNPQTMDYIRSLEQRVKHLEWEKKQPVQSMNGVMTAEMNSNTNTIDSTYTASNRMNHFPHNSIGTQEQYLSNSQYPAYTQCHVSQQVRQQYLPPHRPLMSPSCLSPPPEVTEAMRSLRVRDHTVDQRPYLTTTSSTASCPPVTSSSRSKMNKTPDSALDAEDQEVKSAFENQRQMVRSFVNVAWKKIEDGARIVSGRRSLSRERRSRKKSF